VRGDRLVLFVSALFEPNVEYRVTTPLGRGRTVAGFQVGVWAITYRESSVDPDPSRARQSLVPYHAGWHIDHWPSGRLMAQLDSLSSALVVADDVSIALGAPEDALAIRRTLLKTDVGAWLNTVTPAAAAVSLRAWRASQAVSR
jgi:hypothetical protein